MKRDESIFHPRKDLHAVSTYSRRLGSRFGGLQGPGPVCSLFRSSTLLDMSLDQSCCCGISNSNATFLIGQGEIDILVPQEISGSIQKGDGLLSVLLESGEYCGRTHYTRPGDERASAMPS